DEESILARLAAADDRPLMQGAAEERRQRIRHLLHQRRLAYGAIAYQLDTTGLAIEQVADRILDLADADRETPGMIRIPVRSPDGSYDLLLGSGLLANAGRLLANRGLRPTTAAVVTNDMIREHAAVLSDSLGAAGFEPVLCLVPEGEQHKTLDTVRSLYDQFLAAGLDR
ncbi:MAG: hypothetical protein KDE24_20565, partial [Caldilinea sp.]|nr:hypothetical protein [Caldilinea sp.]